MYVLWDHHYHIGNPSVKSHKSLMEPQTIEMKFPEIIILLTSACR